MNRTQAKLIHTTEKLIHTLYTIQNSQNESSPAIDTTTNTWISVSRHRDGADRMSVNVVPATVARESSARAGWRVDWQRATFSNTARMAASWYYRRAASPPAKRARRGLAEGELSLKPSAARHGPAVPRKGVKPEWRFFHHSTAFDDGRAVEVDGSVDEKSGCKGEIRGFED